MPLFTTSSPTVLVPSCPGVKGRAVAGSGAVPLHRHARAGSGRGVSTSTCALKASRDLHAHAHAHALRAGRGVGKGSSRSLVLCRTEAQGRRGGEGGADARQQDQESVLLKDLLHHATQSRQRLHQHASIALSTLTDGKSQPTPAGEASVIVSASLDTLDFSHDNDYNPVNIEKGKQVLSGSLVYEVLTMDWKGSTFRAYLKRRDVLRHYDLQPRDLRRVDPALGDPSPCLSVRDNAILISLGGMRGIISANKAIIFEPDSPYTKKFVEIVSPRLAASSGINNLDEASTELRGGQGSNGAALEGNGSEPQQQQQQPGESASSAASFRPLSSIPSGGIPGQNGTSGQESGLSSSTKYRKVEDKNLPFELECCEGALMVLVGQLDNELDSIELRIGKLLEKLPAQVNTENLEELRKVKSILVELENKSEQVTELLADFLEDEDDIAGMNLTSQLMKEEEQKKKIKKKSKARKSGKSSYKGSASQSASKKQHRGGGDLAVSGGGGEDMMMQQGRYVPGEFVTIAVDDSEIENILEEAEEELEEVEDLIEYYLQRCTSIFSETETLLVGMRDMEESIGVVLSSRRFEVNRLELALSMGSFAASLGAMISGIFGMNMRNKFEMSVAGFYGTTAGIIVLCVCVFWALYKYTKRRKIL